MAHIVFRACAPVTSIGNGVRITASGATSSSIVLSSSSRSPVLAASWNRLNDALLAATSAVDMPPGLFLVEEGGDVVGNVDVGEDVLNVVEILQRVDQLDHLAGPLEIH